MTVIETNLVASAEKRSFLHNVKFSLQHKMDTSKFTDQKTGTLVPISAPEKDFSFIPDALPAQWQFDGNLWPLLAEAKRCLGLLDGVPAFIPSLSHCSTRHSFVWLI